MKSSVNVWFKKLTILSMQKDWNQLLVLFRSDREKTEEEVKKIPIHTRTANWPSHSELQ